METLLMPLIFFFKVKLHLEFLIATYARTRWMKEEKMKMKMAIFEGGGLMQR